MSEWLDEYEREQALKDEGDLLREYWDALQVRYTGNQTTKRPAMTPGAWEEKTVNETNASTQALTRASADVLEKVVVGGDLSKLSAVERMQYYAAVCASVGLNPLTQPFQYLYLQNKMTLYARKEATEQLRELHGVSVTKLETNLLDDGDEAIYTVTAYGTNAKGRIDSSTGAVVISGLRGEQKANALMKAETKAKRRLTLSLCGLGMLDESEVEIPVGAVTSTEVVQDRIMARHRDGDIEVIPRQEVSTLFPTPEEDRAKLVGRARMGVARMDKTKVATLKTQHFGSAEAKYEDVDLAALVAFVNAVEVPL